MLFFLLADLHHNQLTSVHLCKKENGGIVEPLRNGDIKFIFIAQKDKSTMVKCKLCSGQKQLHHITNTTSALCKHLQR